VGTHYPAAPAAIRRDAERRRLVFPRRAWEQGSVPYDPHDSPIRSHSARAYGIPRSAHAGNLSFLASYSGHRSGPTARFAPL